MENKEEKQIIKQIRKLCRQGFSEMDIRRYCSAHAIPETLSEPIIAEFYAPDCCTGCIHISSYRDKVPCSKCSRGRQDLYESAPLAGDPGQQ